MASEASYVYIRSGKKFIKMSKIPEACGQTVLPDRSKFELDKNWWKMPKLKNSKATLWVIFEHCWRVGKRKDWIWYSRFSLKTKLFLTPFIIFAHSAALHLRCLM